MNIYESIKRLEQSIIENKYCLKLTREKVREDIMTLKEEINSACGLMNTYINGNYYESKNIRLDHLATLDLNEVILTVFDAILPNDNEITIQQAVGMIAPKLGYIDIFDGVRTAAELIAVLSPIGLYKLNPAVSREGKSISIVSNIDIDSEVKKLLQLSMYLPPMVCKPMKVRNNTGSGYLHLNESVILNNGFHTGNVSLDIINILARIPLALDLSVVEYEEPYKKSDKQLSVIEQKEHENNFIQQRSITESLHLKIINENNNRFYINWKFDSRGRIYAEGYHINMQSTKHKKACIQLHSQRNIKVTRGVDKLSPYDYLLVDIANRFGKDKLLWKERMDWVERNINSVDLLEAEDPFGAIASINALKRIDEGKPTGRLIELDASSSFLQILAVLSGCEKTAYQCNLTNSGKRQDFYSNIVDEMNKSLPPALQIGLGKEFTRQDIKAVGMTVFYGSKSKPIELFGEDTQQYHAFYNALESLAPGAVEVMNLLRSCWDINAYYHVWTLPDMHTACVPVTEVVKKKIEIDELSHATFTYQCKVVSPSKRDTPILANVVQSYDAYLMRETIRRASKESIDLLGVHDAYLASPKDMGRVREIYKEVLIDLSNSNELSKVISELKGGRYSYKKHSNNLYLEIQKAEYFIS